MLLARRVWCGRRVWASSLVCLRRTCSGPRPAPTRTSPSRSVCVCVYSALYYCVLIACVCLQARCSDYPTARHTYWNFTLLDDFVLDFWSAVNGNVSAPIPSFSTQPTWLYSPSEYTYTDDPDTPWYGYDRGLAPAQNLTLLGDYYGRLLSWYTQGGMTDEYGYPHNGGHKLNITLVEVFNEPDYEVCVRVVL